MSSSFQQIPVGIPASQNPYPSVPYSQNFPNESDTESSQPLNSHPQHYYPPIYGQQPLLTNQSGHLYGAAHGSNQQPQFLVVPIDPESNRLNMKISDFDKTLKSGCYSCYLVWIYLGIIGAIVQIIQILICYFTMVSFERKFGESHAISVTIGIFISMISYIWALHFSFVLKNAMKDKNLEGAKRGLKSIIGHSVYSLIILIGSLLAAQSDIKTLPGPFSFERNQLTPALIQGVLSLYALDRFVWIFGAKKVIELLTERETSVHELNRRFASNMA